MHSEVYMAYPTSPMVKELNYKVTWSKPSFPIDPGWAQSIASCWIDPDCYCARGNILDRSADRSRLANRSSDRSQILLFATEISGSIGWSIQKPTVRGTTCPIDQLIDGEPSNRSADRSEFLISAKGLISALVRAKITYNISKLNAKHSNITKIVF